MNLAPTLIGRRVRLAPLTLDVSDALVAAATEPGAAYPFTLVPTDAQAAASYISGVLAEQTSGSTIAFAIVDVSRARVVGVTRFLDLAYWPNDPRTAAAPADGRPTPSAAEVGGTWLAGSAQRTAINTEAKLLMLRHAFETWAVHRVTLETDARNTQSRQAIQRIGATFEGIRRAHLPALDGTIRDTAYYSILAAEWTQIAKRLQEMLDRRDRNDTPELNATVPRQRDAFPPPRLTRNEIGHANGYSAALRCDQARRPASMNDVIGPQQPAPVWDASTYDAPRRRLVPDFDRFYGTAAELVADLGRHLCHVLDLGAGTGLLSAAVLRAVPGARLTLLDGDAAMLAVARQRLGDQPSYLVADLAGPLPNGPFDAVVSALAIHHLPDRAKQELFGTILTRLRPAGVFVNAEQVIGPTDWHTSQYAAAHERDSRTLGSDNAEWHAAVQRMAHDRCAPVEDQLSWLRIAGYERVDLAFKRYGFAVYAGYGPSNQI